MAFKWIEDGKFDNLPLPCFDDLRPAKGFAVIDLETTGFTPPTDKIVEIGVVLMDENFQPTHKIETLVNPMRSMNATRIHKIAAKDVEHSPRFQDISLSLFALLNGRSVVAHNVGFEQRFLVSEFEKASFVNLKFLQSANFFDTMIAGPKQIPNLGKSLGILTKAVGISIPAPHEALPDALGTAKLLSLIGPTDTECGIPNRLHQAHIRTYDTQWQKRSINYGLSLWQSRIRP